jgi:hypothetical protein
MILECKIKDFEHSKITSRAGIRAYGRLKTLLKDGATPSHVKNTVADVAVIPRISLGFTNNRCGGSAGF